MKTRAEGFLLGANVRSDHLPRRSPHLPVSQLESQRKRTIYGIRAIENPSKHVTEARAAAQRAKLNAQAAQRQHAAESPSKTKRVNGKQGQRDLLSKRRDQTTVARAIEDYRS